MAFYADSREGPLRCLAVGDQSPSVMAQSRRTCVDPEGKVSNRRVGMKCCEAQIRTIAAWIATLAIFGGGTIQAGIGEWTSLGLDGDTITTLAIDPQNLDT